MKKKENLETEKDKDEVTRGAVETMRKSLRDRN